MPKVDRSGKATVLTQEQLTELWATMPQPHRVISQICYYTAARVGEVCQLRAEDIVGGQIVFRAVTTKTDRTKEIRIVPPLAQALKDAKLPKSGQLFPTGNATKTRKVYRRNQARDGFNVVGELPPAKHISTQAFDKALARAVDYLGFEGVSTHSFRRSLATHLYRAGKPLKAIQQITGHASLSNLSEYLDIGKDEAMDVLDDFFCTK
jgi:integrase/recombinase XerD